MANYTGTTFDEMNLPGQLQVGDTLRLNYSGAMQKLELSRFNNFSIVRFKIECWGGGALSRGKGGYSKGEKTFTNTDVLFCYCGGQGWRFVVPSDRPGAHGTVAGGFNGGGAGWYSGAGATDVRLNIDDLDNRIIVAGGGSYGYNRDCSGGGLTGLGIGGATQTSGGKGYFYGSFGVGASTGSSNPMDKDFGGGGGWYGGGASKYDYYTDYIDNNGGGSGYVDGVENGETYDGSTSYGNNGHGYILLTVTIFEKVNLYIIDKKNKYYTNETIKFRVYSTFDKIQVKFNDILIKEFDNLDLSTEYDFKLPDDVFFNLPNGNFIITFLITENNNEEITQETFIKDSQNIEITTNPIILNNNRCAVDVDLDLENYNDITVLATNNANDTNPIWEDKTKIVLKRLNFLLSNNTKQDANWALSIKIINKGKFKLSEKIKIGYYELKKTD